MLFYRNSDCTGTVEASGNNGCVDFTGLGANVQSYKLNKSGTKRDRRVRRDDGDWWKDDAKKYRELLGLAEEDATGSLSPNWDPYAATESGFGHGNITELWGETYKWHQVALGITFGIPLDEWDDDVHVLSDDFVMYGDDDYDALLAKRWDPISVVARDELEKRWNYGQCRAVLSCAYQFADAATANIGKGWRQGVNAAYKVKTYGKRFYDFTHRHPFSVGVATGVGVSGTFYALGNTGGGATAQDNDQLQSCADGSNQKEAFIQSLAQVGRTPYSLIRDCFSANLKQAASASSDNTARVDITLPDGNILDIEAAVYPKGHRPPAGKLCGAA